LEENKKTFYIPHCFYTAYSDIYVAQQHTESIVAFPLQQWLLEIANMLHRTYIAYVVNL